MSLASTLERSPPRHRPPAPRSLARESGQPLDANTQRNMGERFNHDFSGVRVHADSRAAESARGLDSLAYSYGSHVVFGDGQYSPGTPSGDRLLAHELAHVVQQDGADSRERRAAGTSTLEREADRAADAVAGGRSAEIGHRASSPAVLRKDAPAKPLPAGQETPGPAPPALPPKPEVQEWKDVGREKNLDAQLNRKTGWLTLTMRVKFEKDNSLDPWPKDDSKFNNFQGDFCRKVSKRWSFKHFLVPKSPCPGEPAQTVVNLKVTPVTNGEHSVAKVRYTSDEPQSSAWGKAATLDIQDTKKRGDIAQTPVEHEFGHMLGLNHIRCPGTGDCYGKSRDEKADIMGEGSYVSPRDYEVFSEIMSAITGCSYGVEKKSVIPPPNNAGPLGALIGATVLGAAGVALGMLGGPLGAFIGGAIGIGLGALVGYFIGRDKFDKPGDVPA